MDIINYMPFSIRSSLPSLSFLFLFYFAHSLFLSLFLSFKDCLLSQSIIEFQSKLNFTLNLADFQRCLQISQGFRR